MTSEHFELQELYSNILLTVKQFSKANDMDGDHMTSEYF